MRWQNCFQMRYLIPPQLSFLCNGIATSGGTRVHQTSAHLSAPSTDLEAWIEGYASEISHWPHFGFRSDRILIPSAIAITVLSAEVIHSHYWWTFSFTDHNSIDPVTALARSPCWRISAYTVTPRVHCRSWGNMRQILFAAGLLVQHLIPKRKNYFGVGHEKWWYAQFHGLTPNIIACAANTLLWQQISVGLHPFLPHLLDLVVTENGGRSDGFLILSPSQSVGPWVTGYFTTKSDFTLAIGMDQLPSKQHIISILRILSKGDFI